MHTAPSFADIEAAHARVAPHLHRTPILTSRLLDEITGAKLLFKCENFQRTGSFKARGAFNTILSLPDDVARRGVATHSSGNHAAAVAFAARARGIPAHVVMPTTAPAVKKAAVAGYGARILECAPTLAAREAMVAEVVRDTGATLVPPYDHPSVIAGQGSCFLELWADAAGGLDAVTCPVGGGGMLCGTAIAASSLAPAVEIVAAEPEMADDAARGFLPVATVADGLTTSMSALTFGILRRHADAVVIASEEAIVEAMRLIWTRMKILIEPSSAVPLAAMLERRWDVAGKRVGVILTGGNVDLDRLPWGRRF